MGKFIAAMFAIAFVSLGAAAWLAVAVGGVIYLAGVKLLELVSGKRD